MHTNPRHNHLGAEFAERCELRGDYATAAEHWRDAMRDALSRVPRNVFRDRLRQARRLVNQQRTHEKGGQMPAADTNETTQILLILAMAAVSPQEIHPDDCEVPGIYAVEVLAQTPEAKAASVALDAFHSTVPVKILEDFIFSVHTPEGRCLSEDPDHDDYSGGNLAKGLEKIDDEIDECCLAVGTRVRTEDGYVFRKMEDGTWSNGDLIFGGLGEMEGNFTILPEEVGDDCE